MYFKLYALALLASIGALELWYDGDPWVAFLLAPAAIAGLVAAIGQPRTP
jgi:hypothetical protein